MMILTNGLTDTVDEGFLKVANSLIKRLKEARDDIEVVSYERKNEITDTFINPNKFMSSKCVRDACKKHGEVLYVPFPTKKWVMALRVYLLSRFSKKLSVILVLKTPVSFLGKLMLKRSGARIVVFSWDAACFYRDIVGAQRVIYLKTGVDTKRFSPVSEEYVSELKLRYGFDPNKKIVLHVGHLNRGRNICVLKDISEKYQVLLVTSTLTKNQEDIELKKDLLTKSNIRIIDEYVPQIEELYQLSDVYFFPVNEVGNCIDVPLSCMEAAACGKPIITTNYGEMRQMIGREGFFLIECFDAVEVNKMISKAIEFGFHSGDSVKDYDWEGAVSYISNYCCGNEGESKHDKVQKST